MWLDCQQRFDSPRYSVGIPFTSSYYNASIAALFLVNTIISSFSTTLNLHFPFVSLTYNLDLDGFYFLG